MLLRLLKTYLAPYRRPLTFVVLFQLVGTIAALYLPRLNADIIDNGVAKGDTNYIFSTGGYMLAVTLLQIICSIFAVYFGAKTAMGFGRDVRGALFHRVGEFSDREVNQFGAPSLITRNTNDVTQVQMLVLMTCTLLVSAPIMCVGGIIMALSTDLGLSWLLLVSVPVLVVAIGLIVTRMVPQFRKMQTRIDGINRVLREQITGIRVVRAFVREPQERARFAKANQSVTDTAIRAGRLMALMFPTVMLVLNVSSVAVLWFGGHRVESGEIQVGSLMAFLNYLMQILMSVMMATFMAVIDPAGGGVRRAHLGGAGHGKFCPAAEIAENAGPPHGAAGILRRRVRLSGRDRTGPAGPQLHCQARPDHGDHRVNRGRQDDAGLAHPRGCST